MPEIKQLSAVAKCNVENCGFEPTYVELVEGPEGPVLVPWCWRHGVDRAIEPDSSLREAICHDGKAYRDGGRAAGGAVCGCGKKYLDHPMFPLLGYNDLPFLNQICDGTVVKL